MRFDSKLLNRTHSIAAANNQVTLWSALVRSVGTHIMAWRFRPLEISEYPSKRNCAHGYAPSIESLHALTYSLNAMVSSVDVQGSEEKLQ